MLVTYFDAVRIILVGVRCVIGEVRGSSFCDICVREFDRYLQRMLIPLLLPFCLVKVVCFRLSHIRDIPISLGTYFAGKQQCLRLGRFWYKSYSSVALQRRAA